MLEIAYLKSLARPLDIIEVVILGSEIKFVFDKSSQEQNSEGVANAVYKYRNITSLDLARTNSIKLNATGLKESEKMDLAKDFLCLAGS